MMVSVHSPRRVTVSKLAAVAALCVAATAGCSVFGGGDDDETGTAEETLLVPDLSVAVPPSRLTPFCQAMIDLGAELENDPPPDEGARIIEVYESIVDDVPDEIRDDFLSVLARLQAGSPPVTTSAATSVPAPAPTSVPGAGTVPATSLVDADEGYFPDDDPALRLNAYISASCRGTSNNPGPLATQPGVTIVDE